MTSREIFLVLQALPIDSWISQTVISDSMLPTLRRGQKINVRRSNFNEVRKNDIIVFAQVNSYLLAVHRVIKVNNYSLITQGDNNSRPDINPVTEKYFIGEVRKPRFLLLCIKRLCNFFFN